jgi:signal transduction histidine kinase
VQADERRLRQVLLNLLGNAVKFTEAGHVSATVSQDASGTVIAVEDSGCGIEAGEIEHIFEEFFQGAPRGGAKHEGTGLGLAVSRRLADSIGGRIEVASKPDRGSVFTLRMAAPTS